MSRAPRSQPPRRHSPPGPRPARAAARHGLFAAMLGLMALGTVDCAQQRAPIDQRQPGGLRKSFFVGANLRDATDDPEFYMNNYVVGASADNSMVPVGTYDDVDRIRWEVQEDLLLARRAYEYVNGADGRGLRGRTETGTVVAAYRITSHFDVRHAYNPSTGEELNVITENTTDRPWYEREYMRVDWSQNLVDNPGWAWLFYGSMFGDLSFQPVRYYEQDPNSPDAPHFGEMDADPQNPRQPGGYFDVTSRWLVSPEMNNDFGFAIPTCLIVNFFSGSDSYECNPQEATIRTSFRRVEDHDFEPLELTTAPYDLVGGPRATRPGFDPGYGTTDSNFHRYAMIHNVWQRSHLSPAVACTSNTDANQDGTADACAAGNAPGSQCDTTTQRCTIPYSQRTIRPIVYYVNAEMPAEFQDHTESAMRADGTVSYALPTADDYAQNRVVTGASETMIATWDLAIRNGIANAREVECRRLGASRGGGDRDTCHRRFFEDGTVPAQDGAFLGQNPRVLPGEGPAVVLCHNPVRATDSQTACRETGFAYRLGDIRFNHLTYWPAPSTRAPFGGIAHWGYDPINGEVVSNGAFNVGRSVEYAAAQQRDYIRLILSQMNPPEDNLSLDEYVNGAPNAVLARHIGNPASAVPPAMAQAELESRVHAINTTNARQALALNLGSVGNNFEAANRVMTTVQTHSTPTPGGTPQSQLAFRGRAQQLLNTPLETDIIDSHFLANSGIDPNSQMTQSLLDRVSPLRQNDPGFLDNLRDTLTHRLEARGFCFQDMGAPPMIGSVALQGVARWFLQRYRSLTPEQRAQRIWQDLRIEAYRGIAIHELGHSLGLYHVPVSSYDSMNYLPQYWQLRTREGRATASCRTGCSPSVPNCPSMRNTDRNEDNCMGPRYIDPETDEELGVAQSEHPHPDVQYFGNTSVMEYQWERFGETVGLGSYDVYAMGMLYGRVVETMESDPARGGTSVEQQTNFAPRLRTQLADQDRITYVDPSLVTQPTTLPVHYTELARQMNIFDPGRCRAATPAEQERYRWRLVDGQICSFPPRDHAAFSDMESGEQVDGQDYSYAPYWRTRAGTPTGEHAVRWGYRVAWDIGTGYPHINYFDEGADIYEVAQSIMRKYELTYPTTYFRRSQREWQWWAIDSSIYRRIFRTLRGYHWSVARDSTLYASLFSQQTYDAVAADDNYLRTYLVTGSSLFDFFAGTMLRPEVGEFYSDVDRITPEMRAQHRALFDVPDNGSDSLPQFTLGVVDGRFIGEDVDNRLGGSWDYSHYVIRTGAYNERPFAAIALTDTRPTFSSITRSLYLDGREFQMNFQTDMPDAYNRLLGGILSEDWSAVAMHVDRRANFSNPTAEDQLSPILPRLWADAVHRYGDDRTTVLSNPNHAGVLFPNIGYRQQLPAVVYSMLFSSLNSNLDTIHRTRIFTEGGVETVDIPEAERVRFYNPETGITYVARRYGADPGYGTDMVGTRVIDRGIGSRMIQHANALLTDCYQSTGTNADGTPQLARDTSGNFVPARTGVEMTNCLTRYHNYVGLVDATRFASRLLGYGTLN